MGCNPVKIQKYHTFGQLAKSIGVNCCYMVSFVTASAKNSWMDHRTCWLRSILFCWNVRSSPHTHTLPPEWDVSWLSSPRFGVLICAKVVNVNPLFADDRVIIPLGGLKPAKIGRSNTATDVSAGVVHSMLNPSWSGCYLAVSQNPGTL